MPSHAGRESREATQHGTAARMAGGGVAVVVTHVRHSTEGAPQAGSAQDDWLLKQLASTLHLHTSAGRLAQANRRVRPAGIDPFAGTILIHADVCIALHDHQ